MAANLGAPVSDEFGISPVALDALERDFVEVMKELSAEDNLERFRLEYEKLHRALKKSHESEKRLIKKCQELHKEIMDNAAKVQSALGLSRDDENTINSLKKEIEKAWKMVDSAHEKESRAKDTIQMLKKEVNRLTTLVEQGAGLTLGQETNLQDLIEEKREYTKERDALSQKVVQQMHQLRELNENVRRLDGEYQTKEQDLTVRTATYSKLHKEHEVELRKKELAEARVQDLHKAIEKRTKELDALKEDVRRRITDNEKLEKMLKEERDKVHELMLKKEKEARELQAHTEQLGQIDAQNVQYKKDIPRLQAQLDIKDKQLATAQAKHYKLQRTVEVQDRELEKLVEERTQLASLTGGFESKASDLTNAIERQKRLVEDAERKVKDKVRDKNLTITKAVRDETKRVELDGDRVVEHGKNRSLEQELDAHLVESQHLRKKTYDLERQREKYKNTAMDATDRYNEALDQVKQGKHRVSELQAELLDAEKKVRNQNSMYEQVLSDRNLYSKDLNEAQDEIGEMERKFRVMDQQINQLKDELRKRESDLCEAHARHDTVVKEHKSAEERVKHLDNNLKEARGRGSQLAEEIKQLTQIIADCDTEKAKQQMKFNSVTNERNILATQLIRRNEELALLYEKIRIQQSTLLKGETQYRERLVDITMLRKKVQELRQQLRTSLARIRYVEEMKHQITTLQRQLIHERTRVKALFEELQNPMNVHRWRKLEGSDPQEYENVLKLQTLQRRLIAKTEESRVKDAVILDKEKQYNELKTVLSRQPGPEIAEQLTVFHESILKRAEQMSHMAEELGANNTQIDEYRLEMDRLQAELADVKKKFFNLKSKNVLLVRDRQLKSMQPQGDGEAEFMVHQPTNQPRYAGGGFCLSI
jgi:chromosome segregation ATPase